MSFNILDIISIAIITLFVIRSYVKGFASEFLSMAAMVLATIAAVYFYKKGGMILRDRFWPGLKIIPEIAAFAGLFLIVFVIIKMIEMTVKGIINKIEVTSADRALGIVFGLLEGAALVSLILFLLKVQPLFDSSALLNESFFARIMLPLITGRESLQNV